MSRQSKIGFLPTLPGPVGLFFFLAALLGASSACRSGFISEHGLSLPVFGRTSDPRNLGYEPEYIHWFDQFAFIRASGTKIRNLKQKYGSDFPPIQEAEYQGDHNVYRIRKKDAAFFQNHGYSIIVNGPYRWIDPGIGTRKLYTDLQRWMQGYKDEEMVEKIMHRLEARHPDLAKVYRIGTSVQDRPIYALRISRGSSPRPALLYNSGIHGSEILSIEYSLDLACALLNESCNGSAMDPNLRNRILDGAAIWIVPVVNPDGLHRFWNENGYMGRKNANGVDLNRNFPFYWKSGNQMASSGSAASYKYRGKEPGSEPEVKMMMELARKHRFVLSLSFHTYATRVLFPYTADGAANPYPDPAAYLATSMASRGISYRQERQYEAARKLYSVDGTDQDWLYHEMGIMAFIVEGSMGSPSWEDANRSIQGMRPIVLESLRLFLDSPRLSIRVLDRRGLPIENATVDLISRTMYEGEDWPRTDGSGMAQIFLVPGEEPVIEIRKPGYQSVRRSAPCASVCNLRFQLTPVE